MRQQLYQLLRSCPLHAAACLRHTVIGTRCIEAPLGKRGIGELAPNFSADRRGGISCRIDAGRQIYPISDARTRLTGDAKFAYLHCFVGTDEPDRFVGGLRMLLIGGGAGTLTFLIGRMLGVALA